MTTNVDKTNGGPSNGGNKASGPADVNPVAKDAVTVVDPRLLVRQEGFKGYLTEFGRKMRSGDLGAVPVIVGIAIIWAVFQWKDSAFLSPKNLSDLSILLGGTGMISVGIVFVLLLGEIDLSVGSLSGLAAATLAVLNVNEGVPEGIAVLAALASGAVLGALHGFFFAKIGVPAFVVTLAGLLAWNGLMLQVLGTTGTISIADDSFVRDLTAHYFSQLIAAYGVAALATAGFFLAQFLDSRRRKAVGVPSRPLSEILVRTGVLALIAFTAAWRLNEYKGLPLALVIFVAVLVILDFVVRRTAYGRKVIALGGSVEAARRAGINVVAIRISVYSLAGLMAAFGGIMIASRIGSASQQAGTGNLLMEAIAAAVIGGTSLFGGRGSVWSALLGMLVIGSISSGMNLLGVANSVQYMITGGVLLAAVVIDSVSRRTQRSAGRG
ncbi:sugar ABC transporter permease [Streptomyces antimycoticus]|uniref:Xylose transport system permease protein XylH n=5 Tax=Streptomyces TaxID=1883 RepID=A0ABD5J736_9ACTN|nr:MULTISPECIES: ABC transporter permease [Streptomyces]MEE4583422.1 sugar ABC transporter permease [Streptomyces sp. DSM 41602]AJZ83106.1 sugar ABC transporter permease [Streptomyces sp. AgN23]KUL67309.1 ABC transporter permease [Streptomyces violaceusniger]RSS36218.1 sugar ABC transporter permease [Streptomyces sp. WAC05858]WJD96672.1 sugar ABC transporter permease [Streptomyces antimycoticus]